jgi:hypothetical protein
MYVKKNVNFTNLLFEKKVNFDLESESRSAEMIATDASSKNSSLIRKLSKEFFNSQQIQNVFADGTSKFLPF